MGQFAFAGDFLGADLLVSIYVQVVKVNKPVVRNLAKDGRAIGLPGDIAHRLLEVEQLNLARAVLVPYLHSPVLRGRNKDVGVEGVPPDGINSHQVPLIRHKVLLPITFAALMDLTFFGCENEQILARRVEVHAGPASQAKLLLLNLPAALLVRVNLLKRGL